MASASRFTLSIIVLLAFPTSIQTVEAGKAKSERSRSLSTVEKKVPKAPAKTQAERAPKPKKKNKKKATKAIANENIARQGLKVLLPDLQVEIAPPVSNSHPAIAKVHNKGAAATPASFLTLAEIELSCEAGKLKSKVNAADETPSVQPIPAGSFRYVYILPAGGSWGGPGCYYNVKLRADQWGTIKEVNEKNNTGYAHFCPQGVNCY